MIEFITQNLPLIMTTLFGSSSFLAFILEKNKRKLEEKQIGTDALKSMQDAYDKFTSDSLKRYEDLSSEVSDLKKKLTDVSSELDKEKHKYNTLKSSYTSLKNSYDSLKKQFDALKK